MVRIRGLRREMRAVSGTQDSGKILLDGKQKVLLLSVVSMCNQEEREREKGGVNGRGKEKQASVRESGRGKAFLVCRRAVGRNGQEQGWGGRSTKEMNWWRQHRAARRQKAGTGARRARGKKSRRTQRSAKFTKA